VQSIVWIKESAIGSITVLAEDKYPLETGGILIGYSAGVSELVVTNIVGPGPAAVHESSSFKPDYDFHAAESARLFNASGGTAVYLGDWHTHPDSSLPIMSWKDRKTLTRIARSADARIPRPIMLIAAGRATVWRPRAWRGEQSAMWKLLGLVECVDCRLRTYT